MTQRLNLAVTIPLESNLDIDNIKTLSHKWTDPNNQSHTARANVPIYNGESGEYLIHFLAEFDNATLFLNWTEAPTLFNMMTMHLKGSSRTSWLQITAGVEQTHDEYAI